MDLLVDKILRDYLKVNGKMIRSQLIELFGQNFEVSIKDTRTISRAAEMIHNASLIHDDVIDMATMRRGQKTLHQIIPHSQAVLAGDYLLAKVIAEIVESGHFKILKTLAETLEQIVEGEFLQDELKKNGASTFAELTKVANLKTGALLAWSCTAPAYVSNQSEQEIHRCHTIGLKLGVAFQMIDDNLDYSYESGKDFAKDLKEGLINFTTLELITSSPDLYYSVHQIRSTDFKTPPWTKRQIQNAKDGIRHKAQHLIDEVKDLVESLGGNNHNKILTFVNLLQERVK